VGVFSHHLPTRSWKRAQESNQENDQATKPAKPALISSIPRSGSRKSSKSNPRFAKKSWKELKQDLLSEHKQRLDSNSAISNASRAGASSALPKPAIKLYELQD